MGFIDSFLIKSNSYEKIEGDYIFKSLYDSEGFNLAEVITVNNFKKNNDSLQIILKKLVILHPITQVQMKILKI